MVINTTIGSFRGSNFDRKISQALGRAPEGSLVRAMLPQTVAAKPELTKGRIRHLAASAGEIVAVAMQHVPAGQPVSLGAILGETPELLKYLVKPKRGSRDAEIQKTLVATIKMLDLLASAIGDGRIQGGAGLALQAPPGATGITLQTTPHPPAQAAGLPSPVPLQGQQQQQQQYQHASGSPPRAIKSGLQSLLSQTEPLPTIYKAIFGFFTSKAPVFLCNAFLTAGLFLGLAVCVQPGLAVKIVFYCIRSLPSIGYAIITAILEELNAEISNIKWPFYHCPDYNEETATITNWAAGSPPSLTPPGVAHMAHPPSPASPWAAVLFAAAAYKLCQGQGAQL